MIGLAGSHRTGKTTLAKKYAEFKNLNFVQTSSSAVFKELGFDPKMDYDIKLRIHIQNAILDAAEREYKKAGNVFISDRTPIDMLAYTMADVQRENMDADSTAMFVDYMNRCFEVSNRHFSLIVIVQPGIPLIEEEGKAPANTAYMEHINSLVFGLTVDTRSTPASSYIKRSVIDLDKRVSSIDTVLRRSYERHIGNYGDVMLH